MVSSILGAIGLDTGTSWEADSCWIDSPETVESLTGSCSSKIGLPDSV